MIELWHSNLDEDEVRKCTLCVDHVTFFLLSKENT
jgi:hypothetical protein